MSFTLEPLREGAPKPEPYKADFLKKMHAWAIENTSAIISSVEAEWGLKAGSISSNMCLMGNVIWMIRMPSGPAQKPPPIRLTPEKSDVTGFFFIVQVAENFESPET